MTEPFTRGWGEHLPHQRAAQDRHGHQPDGVDDRDRPNARLQRETLAARRTVQQFERGQVRATSTHTALEVTGLSVALTIGGREVEVVSDMTFAVQAGECLGIIGESGSGKTLTLRAIAGILPNGARISQGSARVGGIPDVSGAPPSRGQSTGLAMVFQEPRSALNPTMRAGRLVEATLRRHHELSRRDARRRAEQLFVEVGIPDPQRRARAWPHELSGGLCQRVMIAAALATDPRVLLCDEPTTALDVSIQDQILGLIDGLRVNRGLSVVFVSHDLEVVAQISQRVVVMYAGRVMESGPTRDVILRPRHPYTAALLRALPSLGASREPIESIPGSPPILGSMPSGCRFAPRCRHATAECLAADGALFAAGPERATACIHAQQIFGAVPQ